MLAQTHVNDLRRQLTREELDELDRMLMMERKSSGLVAGLAAIGLVGVAGVHRFVLGDVGKGILMLLTAGGCGIWTIVDLVRSSTIASDYNIKLELDAINRILERKRAHSGPIPPAAPVDTSTAQ